MFGGIGRGEAIVLGLPSSLLLTVFWRKLTDKWGCSVQVWSLWEGRSSLRSL